MRRDLKEELKERLMDSMGPMRYSTLAQVDDVVDLLEEVVDHDADRRENDRLSSLHGHGPGYD